MKTNGKSIRSIYFLAAFLSLGLIYPLFSIDIIDHKVITDDLNKKITSFSDTLKQGSDGSIKLEFKKGNPFVPEGVPADSEKGLERVAAYDVGSTGVKFKIADVDPKTSRIVNNIYSTTKNTESLGFAINESNYMDRIAIMAGLKAIVEEYFPSTGDVKHVAVATAGFRQAGEKGIALAKMITEMTGIDFKIIDQKDEGLLAYYGVMAKVKDFNPSKDIVWDIGGGSSQVVLNKEVNGKNELKFYGVEVGGNKFNQLVRQVVKGYEPDEMASKKSANPMTNEEVNDVIEFAKYLLTVEHGIKELQIKPFTAEDIEVIKNKVSQEGKVYAIGAVHNFVARQYADKMAGDSAREYYTKDDIKKAIDEATNKSDDEIFNELKGGNGQKEFVKADITSLILVYAMMDVLGISRVYPIDASNTDGLIIKAVLDKNTKAAAEGERPQTAPETAKPKAPETPRKETREEKAARLRAKALRQ